MLKNKTYNFRIYPNQFQKELLAKTFGCCGFLYNQMLAERQGVYDQLKDNKDKLYSYIYKSEKQYKQLYEWLSEPDSIEAYKKFFSKQNRFPKFKNRHNKQSYRTVSINNNLKVDFENKKIKLPKLGWINYKDDRQFSVPIRNITISRGKAGNYYAAILVQENINLKSKKTNYESFITISTGEKIKSPVYYQKTENKLKQQQKLLSKKTLDRNRIKVARLYQKIRNQKTDFLQKLSTKIISENQTIVLEDLSIKNMLQNKYLSKSIQQQNWYEFVSMLKYKADWYGRQVEVVNRYFPSSQLCSNCEMRI